MAHSMSESVTGLRRVATLWQLAWNENRLSCVVYRNADGFQLSIESLTAVVITEPFSMQPRALARSQALRAALKRQGWQEVLAAPDPIF